MHCEAGCDFDCVSFRTHFDLSQIFTFFSCRFGGHILAGLQRKSMKTKNFHFSYCERTPLATSPNKDPTNTTTDGAPATLLLLHGFTSNKESWVRVIMGLPREWRILVLDMPGHGESSFDPTLDYSPPGMADKVHMVGLLHTQWNL